MKVSRTKQHNIECHVRLKPVPHGELSDDLHVNDNVITLAPRQRGVNSTLTGGLDFRMTKILPTDADQGCVFKTVVLDVVNEALNGTSGCVLAYGQTGAGKTYTMTGPGTNYNDRGMIPRSISHVFEHVERINQEMGKNVYTVRISYVEIYQDRVIDLLTKDHPIDGITGAIDNGKDNSSHIAFRTGTMDVANARISNTKNSLQITEDKNGTVLVPGLTMPVIRDESEALGWLFTGESNRVIAEHALNNASTRSHCVFTFYIEHEMAEDTFLEQTNASQQTKGTQGIAGSSAPPKTPTNDKSPSGSTRTVLVRSKFHLVDLAGSERIQKTHSKGVVRREAQYINQSLSFLEQVVLALTEKDRRHIPYRSSRLTHLLKDALGGNSITRVIVAVWPHMHHVEETVSTLRFALRMMRVKTKPRREAINIDDGAAGSFGKMEKRRLVEYYEEIIAGLQSELALRDMLQSSMHLQSDYMMRSPTKKTTQTHDELSPQDRQWVTKVVDHFIVTGKDRADAPASTLDSEFNPSVDHSTHDASASAPASASLSLPLGRSPSRPSNVPPSPLGRRRAMVMDAKDRPPPSPRRNRGSGSPQDLDHQPLLGGRLCSARQVLAAFHVFRDKVLELQKENTDLQSDFTRIKTSVSSPTSKECLDNPNTLSIGNPVHPVEGSNIPSYTNNNHDMHIATGEDAIAKKIPGVHTGKSSARSHPSNATRATDGVIRSHNTRRIHGRGDVHDHHNVGVEAEGDPTPAVTDDSIRYPDVSAGALDDGSSGNRVLYEDTVARDKEVAVWVSHEGKELYARYTDAMESVRQINKRKRDIMAALNELKRSIDEHMTKLKNSRETSEKNAKLMNLSEEQAELHHETYVKNIQTLLHKTKSEYREKWDVLTEKKKEVVYLEQSAQQLKQSIAMAFSEYWARKCGVVPSPDAPTNDVTAFTETSASEPTTYPETTERTDETVVTDDVTDTYTANPSETTSISNVPRVSADKTNVHHQTSGDTPSLPTGTTVVSRRARVARGSAASAVMALQSKPNKNTPTSDTSSASTATA